MDEDQNNDYSWYLAASIFNIFMCTKSMCSICTSSNALKNEVSVNKIK